MRPIQMNSTGNIIGLVIGIFLGMRFGIVGLITGMFIGNKIDELIRQQKPKGFKKRTPWTKQTIEPTFQILGHLAKFDGNVSIKTIEIVSNSMDRFRFTKAQKNLAKKAFTDGKNEQFNPFSTIQKLQMALMMYPSLRNSIAGVFVRVADDGRASKQKLEQLDRLLRSIGIIRAQYTHHQSSTKTTPSIVGGLSWAYRTLGVSQADNMEQIKRKYRKLLSDHHPDRLHTKESSPSESAIKQANERTHEIKKAYTLLKSHREQQQA
ncbi:MAG: hypothetical protein CMF52_04950 [Legionellales bacterium]|nr:hypothetical protein [Legionellales bacterium]